MGSSRHRNHLWALKPSLSRERPTQKLLTTTSTRVSSSTTLTNRAGATRTADSNMIRKKMQSELKALDICLEDRFCQHSFPGLRIISALTPSTQIRCKKTWQSTHLLLTMNSSKNLAQKSFQEGRSSSGRESITPMDAHTRRSSRLEVADSTELLTWSFSHCLLRSAKKLWSSPTNTM